MAQYLKKHVAGSDLVLVRAFLRRMEEKFWESSPTFTLERLGAVRGTDDRVALAVLLS